MASLTTLPLCKFDRDFRLFSINLTLYPLIILLFLNNLFKMPEKNMVLSKFNYEKNLFELYFGLESLVNSFIISSLFFVISPKVLNLQT